MSFSLSFSSCFHSHSAFFPRCVLSRMEAPCQLWPWALFVLLGKAAERMGGSWLNRNTARCRLAQAGRDQ